ncbi:portal protein [Roseococcus thiosulfatophilus]|uniref:portal protein n=1 Tax=Roseococcus thiosulfatophilus TaxID=35813 RepID=UPI001A8D4D85|nr:portal protein [Roseococcus thiosulfatophilus]
MNEAKLEALLKRAANARTKRDAFRALMTDINKFAMPERDSWSSYGLGEDRQAEVFDSTAVVATGRFANRLQQALFPPQQRWAQLDLPPEQPDDNPARVARGALQQATEILFRHIHASNFDQVVNEWGMDLAGGAGAMMVENGRLATRRSGAPLLRFQAVTSGQIAFDEGPFGAVEGIFNDQALAARLIRRTYPDITDLPQALADAEKGDPEREIKLLQATVYEHETADWRLYLVHEGSKAVLVERSYRTNPWAITRWAKAPGEVYGRGPLATALPDIRTLNKLVELALVQASFEVTPAFTGVDDGVLNPDTVRIAPGVIIPVRSNGGSLGPSLAALPMAGNYRLSESLADRLRSNVRLVMFDDPLPPEVKSNVSATEIQERIRRFQADTGAFGRLYTDAVVPIILRCVDILDEAGAFAGIPALADLLDVLKDDLVRVQPTSPLAQAQNQADADAVLGVVGSLASLGRPGEAMLRHAVSLKRAGPFVARRAGVREELIPTDEELKAEDEAAAKAQQEEALLKSPVVGQAVGNVLPAIVGGQQGQAA